MTNEVVDFSTAEIADLDLLSSFDHMTENFYTNNHSACSSLIGAFITVLILSGLIIRTIILDITISTNVLDISQNQTFVFSAPSASILDIMPSSEGEPSVHELSTPQLSEVSVLSESGFSTSQLSESASKCSDTYSEDQSHDDPKNILNDLKHKNADRPIIGQLNINSIASKFEPLVSLIKDNVDLLMVSETKVDDSFPRGQFEIEGYSSPIRLDRNRHGGGVMIFSRVDLPCHELKSHNLPIDIECTFLELRIRQSKWLVVAGYNPHKNKISYFLENIGRELDKYLPNYENLLMLGDWNSAVTENDMKGFCQTYNLQNLIREPTCFKNVHHPSSIDIMLTNKKLSFQNSITLETGLSDFHKMTLTVLKRYFKKNPPITITYRDLKAFDGLKFREDIRNQLEQIMPITHIHL